MVLNNWELTEKQQQKQRNLLSGHVTAWGPQSIQVSWVEANMHTKVHVHECGGCECVCVCWGGGGWGEGSWVLSIMHRTIRKAY